MNERLEHHAAVNRQADLDHSVLAELIAGRWKQDRPYFTPKKRTFAAWLGTSWRRQPSRNALELHWSCRPGCIVRAGLLPRSQAASDGAA